jgi:hypothetical protein
MSDSEKEEDIENEAVFFDSDEEFVVEEENLVFRHKTLTYWFYELRTNNPEAVKYIDLMTKVLMISSDKELTEENLNSTLLERISFKTHVVAITDPDLKQSADIMEISLQDMLDDLDTINWDPLKSQIQLIN